MIPRSYVFPKNLAYLLAMQIFLKHASAEANKSSKTPPSAKRTEDYPFRCSSEAHSTQGILIVFLALAMLYYFVFLSHG